MNHLFVFAVNSTCSTGSKYDVDLLRADVGQCKARVHKLKRELVKMDAEVCMKQKGMETLARVKDKYSCSNGEESNEAVGLTLEEARAIKTELNNIQKSLTVGEQEKIELMKNLACLKDDLIRLQHTDPQISNSNTNDIAKQTRLSTASQTDLCGEVGEKDGYTNELLSGGTTNYFESGTTNSCIFSKSGTTNSWLFNRRIMNSIRIELKNIIKTYLS